MTGKTHGIPNWVFTLLISGGALVYALVVFVPGQRLVAAVHADVRQQCREAQHSNQRALALDGVEQSLKQTREFVETWRENAPQPNEFAPFLGEVNRLETETHVSIKRLTPLGVSRRESVCEHPVEATVEGRFGEIVGFLRRLETLPAAVWIESLDMKPLDEGGTQLRCELILRVFNENTDGSD